MVAELGHVTVVFAGQSESWAKWIDHQIKAAGRATTLVRWNPLRRLPTDQALTDLLSAPGRVLLVIDDWYERLGHGRFEAWADVLRQVLPEHHERIAAVSITARPMPDAVIALAPVELRGLRPEVARSRVLECAGIPAPGTLVDLRRGPRFPDDPPEVWQAPRRNHRFVGRTELLEKVYGAFSAAGPDGAAVALLGPGGLGKTQLALEYVHRFAGEYDVVWWISAAQRVTARQQFAELAPHLDVRDAGDLAGTIKAVRRELDRTARPWLLVLDGAGDPARLRDLLPEGRGHVLVTTHRSEWGAHAQTLAVPVFERRESVAFVARRTDRLSDGQAGRLAQAVEDMPLLLDQTAAWLDQNPAALVEDYIRDIRDGRPDRFGVVASGEYPESFEVAWAKLVNTLRDGSESAWHLLNLLVCFSPDVVPVRLLQTARHGDLPPGLADLIAEPSSWNTALRRLSEITSMRIEYEQGPRLDTQTVGTLRMHRLFHRFVRSIQSPEDAGRYSAAARKVLVSADPRDSSSPGNWARYATLIPHLAPSGALESADDDVRELVLNCVEYLRMRGEYDDGWSLSRRAVEHWRRTSGDTDRSVLVVVHQLANMLRRLGRYTEAEKVGRETLGRLTGAEGVRPIELIRAKDGLGGTLMALGRYTEARTLFEEAAESAAAELGDEHVPRTLTIRSNLAVALGLQGHYAESLALHRRVFEARVELLGGKNALTLNSALHSAWMLRLLGNYREALAIQGHNSRVHSQILDRTHSQTLLAEHNLALCSRRVGDLQFAHALMRGVRDKLLRRRGAAHPETLMVSCDYAMLLRDLDRTEEARELAENTAAQYAAQLGDGHPYAIGARDNVATVMRDMGEIRGALELSRRTTRQMARAVGPDHPWAIGCAKNDVAALASAGESEAAAELGREAADRSARVLGEAHILTISLRAGLALDLAGLGRPEEADALHREAVTRLTALLGADHPHTRYILERRRPYWDFEPQPI
ncbi:tetratricopeptide repeat protein [Streptomyces luteolifulvus]|jgi:tetratricopeptide (TPR) repeat protein|uniref:Tetratricopeptide repeat protein n=1 Tax=Streptomyces luteolifulvus TaxID=2615112 RepID=A0A6H9UYQ2_9ACTN|nr:FxSxx-COOH system tetratricopeptide repeat protein [Streptomyces luteolifulvus]KAB1144419.1 tetratricopeptide repeat protein [Streptomyces luteolifulvus]